jgi:uncharacterized protein (DUF1684 family)
MPSINNIDQVTIGLWRQNRVDNLLKSYGTMGIILVEYLAVTNTNQYEPTNSYI